MDILLGGLLANLLDQADGAAALFGGHDLRAPLAALAVKNEKTRACRKSQHMQKIMSLRMAKHYLLCRVKMICDKEPLLSHCAPRDFVVMT
jgi:hypothetical protein